MININLLPRDLRRSGGPDLWKLGAGATLGVAVLTMAFFQLSAQGTLNGLNKDIEEAQSELAVRQKDLRERGDLRAQKTQLEGITGVSATLKAGQTSWSGDLAAFVRQLPSAAGAPVVALSTLAMRLLAPSTTATPGAYDGKAVTKEFVLSGKARSSDALVRFVNTFESATNFGVQFQSAQREAQQGDYTFNVTVGMVGSAPSAGNVGSAPSAGNVGSSPTAAANSTATPAASASPSGAPVAVSAPPASSAINSTGGGNQ